MRFKTYITEEYNWLSKPKQKFVMDVEKAGKYNVEVSKNTNRIIIARRNKRTGKITKGLIIYPDGTGADVMVDAGSQKIMRSVKDWENILK